MKKTLQFSPIVGIFGHRQVGKTTLAEALGEKYTSLDQAVNHSESMASPEAFLAQNAAKPLVIDECQLSPPLFPAMKEWVRTHKAPGQLLITGSVRFSSRKAIRESLTGRMIAWELLPMDLAEQHSAPLPLAALKLLKAKDVRLPMKWAPYVNEKSIEQYFEQGGLPGIFALRSKALSHQRRETLLNTLMERDLRLLVETSLPYSKLREIIATLSQNIGKSYEVASLSRATRVSVPTLTKLMNAFESMFMIRRIPTEGFSKKPVVYFEDLGEARFLSSKKEIKSEWWASFLYQNLRTQFHYRPDESVHTFNFLARNGDSMPLCFRAGTHILGVFPLYDQSAKADLGTAIACAKTFLKVYPDAKVAILGCSHKDEIISPKIRYLGAGYLL